ncbi:MAG: hypothetical protein QXK06_04020, partial [Candidatus Diapherotrites archaeon]
DEYKSAVNRGRAPKITASQRREQKASFRIFSLDEDGKLCESDSLVLGFGLGPIPIDTVVVLKETASGFNNVFLVPCTSANRDDCKEKTGRIACLIQKERGFKSRCTDTPTDCSGILADMATCPPV